jgi:hypothetical protein
MKRSLRDEDDLRAEGGRTKHRYAKGGKVRHQTNIAIVVPHHKPALGPQDAAGMMAPPMAPGAAPPMGAAPTMGAPGPGLPPRPFRKGGRVVIGEDPREDVSEYRQARPRASGGRLPDAGSLSGVGRKAKAKLYRGDD